VSCKQIEPLEIRGECKAAVCESRTNLPNMRFIAIPEMHMDSDEARALRDWLTRALGEAHD
jgi:hypothetical protein